jgi:hypothetical protein
VEAVWRATCARAGDSTWQGGQHEPHELRTTTWPRSELSWNCPPASVDPDRSGMLGRSPFAKAVTPGISRGSAEAPDPRVTMGVLDADEQPPSSAHAEKTDPMNNSNLDGLGPGHGMKTLSPAHSSRTFIGRGPRPRLMQWFDGCGCDLWSVVVRCYEGVL